MLSRVSSYLKHVISDGTDDFNEGFILPTLIRQLKSILDQYPDDGQILKVGLLRIYSLV